MIRLIRLSAFLVACHPTVDPVCFEADPVVEIGTGAGSFERLREGDPIDVVLGPQGGYHVFVSLRASGVDSVLDSYFQVVDVESSEVLADSEVVLGLRPGSDRCTLEAIGELVVLDIASADEVAGRPVLVYVDVVDSDGRWAESTVPVVLAVAR